MPEVTFIIPAYNAADYLRQSVQAVISQTFTNWELIIVDDGSVDGTAQLADQLAASDSRIRVIHHYKASGSAFLARLTAIKNAISPLIAPIDADDLIPEDYLEQLLSLRRATGADAVFPLMHSMGGGVSGPLVDPFYHDNRPRKGRETLKLTLDKWKVTCNGGIIDRDLYLSAYQDFGEDHRDANADETLTRMLLLKAQVVVFSSIKYIYRFNKESVTHKSSLRRLEILQSCVDVVKIIKANYPYDSRELLLANIRLFNSVLDAMLMLKSFQLSEEEKLMGSDMIMRAKTQVDLPLLKSNVNPVLLKIFKTDLNSGLYLLSLYTKIRKVVDIMTFQMKRPARKYRHLRDIHRHNTSVSREIKELRQGKLLKGSESEQFYIENYSKYSNGSREKEPVVVCPFDGKIYHGGTTDRIRGILSTFAETQRRGLKFRIIWHSPFRLEDYLQPADYDWRINPEELSSDMDCALPVIIQDRNNKESSELLKAALDGIRGQLHIYSNADSEIGHYHKLYRQLFKPSQKLIDGVAPHKMILGDKYWAFHLRFLTLLGDFKDWGNEILSEKDALDLMIRNRDEILKLIKDLPEGYRVFVTSDSRRFLDFISGTDERIYVTPGEIRNIDLNKDEEEDVWLKVFVDQQLLMDAERIYRLSTYRMYPSGYSRFAAEVGGKKFIPHKF